MSLVSSWTDHQWILIIFFCTICVIFKSFIFIRWGFIPNFSWFILKFPTMTGCRIESKKIIWKKKRECLKKSGFFYEFFYIYYIDIVELFFVAIRKSYGEKIKKLNFYLKAWFFCSIYKKNFKIKKKLYLIEFEKQF